MRSKALSFLSQFRRWGLAYGIEELSLCGGARKELPSALALQRALGEALLARDPQQAAFGLTEVAFECVVGPRQARHVIAVKQAWPIAPANRVEMTTKRMEGWRAIGPLPHYVEIVAQLSRDLSRVQGVRGTGF
jgi:hypothetical protein